MRAEKLYLVVRADLPAGQQAVQACHALRGFVEDHPEEDRRWFRSSNHLAMLQTPTEASLLRLKEQAEQ
jgi:peptidyl-tRNA hydrolase